MDQLYQTGDLIIRFNIIFPDSLNKERKQYISKILPILTEEITFSGKVEEKYLENVGERINIEEVNLDSQQDDGGGGGVECAQQ